MPTRKDVSKRAIRHWIGLFVPAKTPPETIERLNGLLRAALRSREVREAYTTLMMEPSGESPGDSARMVAAEYEMWRPIVKASGFTAAD